MSKTVPESRSAAARRAAAHLPPQPRPIQVDGVRHCLRGRGECPAAAVELVIVSLFSVGVEEAARERAAGGAFV